VSGTELTRRAVAQAQRFGAEMLVPVCVDGLSVDDTYKRLKLNDGRELLARSVIAATGMTYREHPAEGMNAYTGAGVYYGAAVTEAHSCRERRVFIIGGGNSAGQSAIHLSRFATEVHIVVRRNSLNDTMSHYLIEQLKTLKGVKIRFRTEAERVEGDGRLERVWLKSLDDNSVVVEEADAVFIFIGTRPHSDWLPPSVLRNEKGFVLTGRDAALAAAFARTWKESREPMPLETTVPGVFAAGDVRANAMNRVAAAVGEGAMAVRLVSDYLSQT
jgi:thioredoxin reductase (NADPH)